MVTLYKRLVLSEKGRVIKDSGWKPSRSYVLQFLQWVYCMNDDLNDLSMRDTGNTLRTVLEDTVCQFFDHMGYVMAGAGVDTYGIVVGTGTAAEDNADYALQTQIAHGSGAGQLEYGGQQETDPAIVGPNVDLLLTRNFVNASGDSITVEEIGLYVRIYDEELIPAARYFLFLRDLETQAVANGQTLTVIYTLRTTV